jgi:hypothetical protein
VENMGAHETGRREIRIVLRRDKTVLEGKNDLHFKINKEMV